MRLLRERTGVRRQQISDAIARLITTRGMESATIRDISAQVGISEGALYRHFTGKREMLSFLLDHIEEEVLARVREAQWQGGSAEDRLRSILDAHLAQTAERGAVSFIIIAEAVSFEGLGLGRRVASLLSHYLSAIRQVLAEGVEEGSVRRDLDLDAAATTFFGLVQSSATLWSLNDYDSALAGQRDQMWEVYLRGIRAAHP